MNTIKLWVGSTLTILASSAAVAHSGIDWKYRPYIGADAQVRRMDFKGGFGDNLMQHHSPQGNVYGGVKLTSSLGIEVGYEGATTRTRTMTLGTGDLVMGIPLAAGNAPAVYKTKAKIKGPHIDLAGFYSFYEGSPQLIGSIGVANLKATILRRTLLVNGVQMNTMRALSERKSVLRLMGGLQIMKNEHWGFRGTVGWVNTNKLVVYTNDGRTTYPEVKPKNSTIFGLGTFWLF